MRFSCQNDILMSFFTGENLIFLTSVESSWESHEILMRMSWENLTKTLFLLLLMNVSCNSLNQDILIENVVSWVFSISRESKIFNNSIRCMHVVFVKENDFEVLTSS